MMGVRWREVEEELAQVSSGEEQVAATNIVTMSTIIVTSIVTNPPTSSS